jgi:hypothetical protein
VKKYLLTTLAILIAWAVTDFLIHNVLLMSSYAATSELWRPLEEMKMWLIYVVEIITIIALIVMYDKLVDRKAFANGILFGLLFGIAAGIGKGYGTYAVQPLPYSMALIWFLGTVVQAVLAGAIIGAMVKE